ncbi:hypothetical protein QT971_22420 [Microcoleus sp. herbarium19]|uniref:hypothetical protein n=1 Tax=unclassified Microcoleus TaxID=2642155 RepID=UPI002FD50A88
MSHSSQVVCSPGIWQGRSLSTTGIILLTIYPKSEQADIDADEIRAIIEQEE